MRPDKDAGSGRLPTAGLAVSLPCALALAIGLAGSAAGRPPGAWSKGACGCPAGGASAPSAPFSSLPQIVQAPVELRSPFSTVTLRADSQRKQKDVYRLEGHVEITYQDMKLTAGEAEYNQTTGQITARGGVTFSDPKAELESDEGGYNLFSEAGWFSNVAGTLHAPPRPGAPTLAAENPFYVQARRIERLDEDHYAVEDARLSSCPDQTTGWSLAVHRARLEVNDQMVSYHDVFRMLRVPLFYSPVLVHSIARNPRQSGFLLPAIGNSSQKGTILGEGFFWAINPAADVLVGVENYSKRGLARNGQFRARPSSTSEINVQYFGVSDRGIGFMRENRAPGSSVYAQGSAANLFDGFRGVVDVDYITSLAFRLTFTDNFTQAVSSEAHQTGFLSRNFGAYSLNFYASRYQDFLSTQQTPGNSITIRETPSVSFSEVEKQIGSSPLYFSFESSAAGVARKQPGFLTDELSDRLDFAPEITLRTHEFAGFRFTPSFAARATHYGTSFTPGQHPLTRLLGEFSADLRPPSLERTFSKPIHGWKLKHVIEPDIRYRLVRARDASELADVVRFDEADVFAETNEIEYSLTSTLLGRPDKPADSGATPQARDLVSLRLSQKYYFDPTFGGLLAPGNNVFQPTLSLTGFAFAEGRHLSPVVTVLKIAPFSNYDTELRADLSPNGGVLNAGITSDIHRGRFALAATDFFVNHTASLPAPVALAGSEAPSFNLLRTVVTYGDTEHKGLSGAMGLDYNFAQGIAHQVVGQVSYNFGCFGLDFGYRRFALGTLRTENQFRLAISLSNVGTFGNLKSRDRLFR